MRQTPAEAPRWPAAGLCAFVASLAICPWLYVAGGALAGFRAELTYIALPLLAASTGYLGYRLLRRPSSEHGPQRIVEALAWLIQLAVTWLLSSVNLQTPVEQLQLTGALLLCGAVPCLPLFLLRDTTLQARLSKLSGGTALLLLGALVAGCATLAAMYWLSDPKFI